MHLSTQLTHVLGGSGYRMKYGNLVLWLTGPYLFLLREFNLTYIIRKLFTNLLNTELELSPSTHLSSLEYFPSLSLPFQHKSRLGQLPGGKVNMQ